MDELFPGSSKLGHCKGLVSQDTAGTLENEGVVYKLYPTA